MTPTFFEEEVRQKLLARLAELPTWQHTRHVFDGTATQGAAIGDGHFYDIRLGATIPLSSDRVGERVETAFTIRFRMRRPALASAEDELRYSEDRHRIPQYLRQQGPWLPGGVEIVWRSTSEPTERVKAFVDTDIALSARYWARVAGPPPGGA
jgi:hypothetical protein